jgi:hypothetical protein
MDAEFCATLVLLTFVETKVRPAAGNRITNRLKIMAFYDNNKQNIDFLSLYLY